MTSFSSGDFINDSENADGGKSRVRCHYVASFLNLVPRMLTRVRHQGLIDDLELFQSLPPFFWYDLPPLRPQNEDERAELALCRNWVKDE